MYRVISCLTEQHDYRLVALAALVCVMASFTAFWLYPSVESRSGVRRWLLLLLAGTCTAAGIWTTHFVAMLAYDGGLPVRYDLGLTLASFLIAILTTTAGFALIRKQQAASVIAGGAIIGLGIASMHFIGMAGIVVAGHLAWDASLVAASIIAGMALSAASTFAHARIKGPTAMLAGPALLTLAICAMHFTAMGALSIVPDPTIAVSAVAFDSTSLALLTAGVTILLMMIGIGTAMLDRFTLSRAVVGFGAAMFATLIATIGISLFALNQVRIGGDNFQRIIAGKDLVADVLPPPAYIIEAYLEVHMAASRPEHVAEHKTRLAKLRSDYLARRAHWETSDLIPAHLKKLIITNSAAEVEHFWRELESQFLPALERVDGRAISASLEQLTAHYVRHRAIIETIVKEAGGFSQNVETSAETRSYVLKQLVLGAVLLLLLVVGAAMVMLRNRVIHPVLETASYLTTLSAGRYDQPLPFAARNDEIGTMARAIDMLRLAAIEKQKLEGEAVEARRRADAARVAREKERVAEAMRLHMANENITLLNEDLNRSIAQLKEMHDEIVRKGKLAQLGQLTATVAHEIRNPLGAVKSAVFFIERKTRDKGLGLEPQMQRIHGNIRRCNDIITELLDFTRTRALTATGQVAGDWVRTVVEEERRNLPAEVEVVVNAEGASEPVLFDAGHMRRVLINLLSNAAEAMVGKGGDPSTRATSNPRIVVATRQADDKVEIVVSDNGPGISPENLAKIREPLFTTKSFGVGLGLPAVEAILEQHGGGLKIESTLGAGATMTAWFPRKTPQPSAGEDNERKVA